MRVGYCCIDLNWIWRHGEVCVCCLVRIAVCLRLPFLLIAGMSAVVAAAVGLLGLADGSFLRPLHADVLGIHLTTALVFDVGVYLAVLGVVAAALNLLGVPRESAPEASTDSAEPSPPAQRSGEDRGIEEARQ